jgi:Ca2+:H+ antiporter
VKHWSTIAPLVAAALLVIAAVVPGSAALAILSGLALIGAVMAAVHHAEVVAHKVGEPLGTLVLALAVTVIEASLILSLMLAGGEDKAVLARDTVYAAVMIICNGVIGLCILVGGIRHREQSFRIEGAGPAFAALVTLATLALVLPNFTVNAPGPFYSPAQLDFAGLESLVLWGVFVFVQTVRHRDYFLPPKEGVDEGQHSPPPTALATWSSLGLLLIALVGVVGLAKVLSPSIEAGVKAVGAPDAVVGIAIAMVVLLPETVAAARAAAANRLQTSMNLALGSALATIGLTIPAVVVASQLFHLPVVLGLAPKDMVLLFLTFLVGGMTLGSGRTSIMQGAVQLVVFAAFLFLSFVP